MERVETAKAGQQQVPARNGRLRRDALLLAVLLAFAAASWLPRLRGPLDFRWDAGIYYVLGTSLASGHGYRLLNEPGEISAVQYPPLLPALIAVHQIAAGTDDAVVVGRLLKLTWFGFFLLFTAATYFLLKAYLPVPWAFAGAMLCPLNFSLYFYASQGSSELPFALAAVALPLAARLGNRHARELAGNTAAAAAFLTRSIGLALIAAWIFEGIRRRDFRAVAVRSAVALLCVAGWYGYIRAVESSSGYRQPPYPYQRAGYLFYNVSYARNVAYKDPFRPEYGNVSAADVLNRLAGAATALPKTCGAAVSTPGGFFEIGRLAVRRYTGLDILPAPLQSGILFTLGTVVIAGVVLLALRREWFIPACTAGTMLLICSTPWPTQMVRYIVPVLPLLLLCFLTALLALRNMARDSRPFLRPLRFAPVIVLTGIFTLQGGSYAVAHTVHFQPVPYRSGSGKVVAYRQLWYREPDRGLDESLDWIRAHARPNDIVAASMPGWTYLRTGIKTVMPPFEEPSRALHLLDSVPVRYLVQEDPVTLTNIASHYMSRMLEAYPEQWRLVHTAPGNFARVYERLAQER